MNLQAITFTKLKGIFCGLILISSFSTSAQTHTIDELRNTLIKVTNRLDADLAASLFTEDAVQFPPGRETIMGSDSIAANYKSFFNYLKSAELNLSPQESYLKKGLAVERGDYLFKATLKNGQEITTSARYILVMEKVRGQWKIKWSMVNKCN